MKRNTRAAFTLAELLIVVAILGILAAIAIPVFTGSLQKVRDTVCAANRTSAQHLVSMAYLLDEDLKLADAQTIVDEQIGTEPCPDTDKAYVVKSPSNTEKGPFTVTCIVHGMPPLEVVKSNVSIILALPSVQAYFNKGFQSLDSTGTNYGDKIRKDIADALKITQEFDFRIYRTNDKKQYYIYLFEPLEGKKTGDELPATRYVFDAASGEQQGSATHGSGKVVEKTMDTGNKYFVLDTSTGDSWT